MATRTAKLAAGHTTATRDVRVVYTVPASTRTIVKSIDVHNWGQDQSDASIYSQGTEGAAVYFLLGPLGTGLSVSWAGWRVLHDGDVVIVSSALADMHYWISGTELQVSQP